MPPLPIAEVEVFSKKATSTMIFESIPLEIRHNVYSHLSLNQNVVYFTVNDEHRDSHRMQREDNVKCGLNFELALFRVSKFIAAEILH